LVPATVPQLSFDEYIVILIGPEDFGTRGAGFSLCFGRVPTQMRVRRCLQPGYADTSLGSVYPLSVWILTRRVSTKLDVVFHAHCVGITDASVHRRFGLAKLILLDSRSNFQCLHLSIEFWWEDEIFSMFSTQLCRTFCVDMCVVLDFYILTVEGPTASGLRWSSTDFNRH